MITSSADTFRMVTPPAGMSKLVIGTAFLGEWHTTVLFSDRVQPRDLRFGLPEVLELEHPAVRAAAEALGIRIP